MGLMGLIFQNRLVMGDKIRTLITVRNPRVFFLSTLAAIAGKKEACELQ